MFKRIKIILLVMSIGIYTITANTVTVKAEQEDNILSSISASAYIVMEANTKTVLYSYNADEKLPMASTTKIMTTLIALEQDDLDEYFTVSTEAIQVEGTSMGLIEGDLINLKTLCYGMLLSSGNDAANATAYKIAGGIDEFASLMNEKAENLGMTNTNFANPSGLPDDNHYSTAYDMALLGSEAVLNEQLIQISSTDKIQVEFGNPISSRWLSNHNKMLEYYDDCVGLKTGYTQAAGRCLVSAVSKDGIDLICVTLNAPNDWVDHTTLLDLAFENIEIQENTYLSEDELFINVVGGEQDTIRISEQSTQSISLRGSFDINDTDDLQVDIILESFYYAPISSGDVVGEVIVSRGGEIISENKITASEQVSLLESPAEQELSIWQSIIQWLVNLL